MATRLIITCEHGGNRIPKAYAARFAGAKEILASHRGWDPGALELARLFAKRTGAPLYFSETSRLVVELNRSLGHSRHFSDFTRELPAAERELLIASHWRPYREAVEREIKSFITAGHNVRHLSVHSFTPVLDGEVRRCDVGLLYDPARQGELDWCNEWLPRLKHAQPDWILRRNYPYRGTSDGFTTSLRKQYPERRYAGIEIEVNQKWPLAGGKAWKGVMSTLAETLVS
jgi:predicted N-formylglutamate amidohydrolase